MDYLDEKSQLVADLQSLQSHKGYQYIARIISNWKEQAMLEMSLAEDFSKIKNSQSDFRICSKILMLPDRLIRDLQAKTNTDFTDFDPYKN